MGRIWRNYIKTRREFKIFYKKGIDVLLEIISSNIKKKKLKLKEPDKGNKWGLKALVDSTSTI